MLRGCVVTLLAGVLTVALGATPASAGPAAPPNPYAGPDGTAGMHGDSAASDTTAWSGPGADARPGWPVTLPAVCPTILAGRDGMVQALCTEYVDRAPSLYLIDPHTWLPVARRLVQHGTASQISHDKACRLRPIPAGFTLAHPSENRASRSNARLPMHAGLVSGFCSSGPGFASGFLRTSPRVDALASG